MWIGGLLLLLLTGCTSPVPATTPPQLSHTPGVPIIITDDTVETSVFRVDYPDGWRVIKTSITGAPPQIVMASTDDPMMIIRVSAIPLSASDATYQRNDTIAVRGIPIYLAGGATNDQRERLDAAYETVRDSLRENP